MIYRKYDRYKHIVCFLWFYCGLNQPIGPSSFFMRSKKRFFPLFFARKQKCGKNFILSHFYHDKHFSLFLPISSFYATCFFLFFFLSLILERSKHFHIFELKIVRFNLILERKKNTTMLVYCLESI